MNTLGWQIGAFLIGASALIIAVYIGKLLNTTNKVVEKVYKIIDYNERHIHETIENVASITTYTEEQDYKYNESIQICKKEITIRRN